MHCGACDPLRLTRSVTVSSKELEPYSTQALEIPFQPYAARGRSAAPGGLLNLPRPTLHERPAGRTVPPRDAGMDLIPALQAGQWVVQEEVRSPET